MSRREPCTQRGAADALPTLQVTITPKMIISGAIASRDWQPIHHDPQWARESAGLRDVIMNNYTQAGWLSRYVTDWSGPEARLARMTFTMRRLLCPGDEALFRGVVNHREQRSGLQWLTVAVDIVVGDRVVTRATLTLALPLPAGHSPWSCGEGKWLP